MTADRSISAGRASRRSSLRLLPRVRSAAAAFSSSSSASSPYRCRGHCRQYHCLPCSSISAPAATALSIPGTTTDDGIVTLRDVRRILRPPPPLPAITYTYEERRRRGKTMYNMYIGVRELSGGGVLEALVNQVVLVIHCDGRVQAGVIDFSSTENGRCA